MTAELALFDSEAADLAELEAVVERGMAAFFDVGMALSAIRDRRLYLQTHETFEDYLADKWGLSRPRAYALMDAATVVESVSRMQDTPSVENFPEPR